MATAMGKRFFCFVAHTQKPIEAPNDRRMFFTRFLLLMDKPITSISASNLSQHIAQWDNAKLILDRSQPFRFKVDDSGGHGPGANSFIR